MNIQIPDKMNPDHNPQPSLTPFTEFCVTLLEDQLGPLLFSRRQGAEHLVREWKSATDYRTTVDTEIEQLIVQALSPRFPDLGLYGEESGSIREGKTQRVIIDSIDGTIAWSRNFGDHYSIAISLVENQEPIASIIHFPHTRESFVAEQGAGAWSRTSGSEHSWKQLQVSAEQSLQRAVLVVDHGKELRQEAAKLMVPLLDQKSGANCVSQYLCASYSMARLAQGRIEAYMGTSVPPDDALPGLLLANEAGAVVSNLYQDTPWSETSRSLLVCCNKAIRDQVRARILT